MSKLSSIYKKTKSFPEFCESYFDYLCKIRKNFDFNQVDLIAKQLIKAKEKGSTIFVAGNGGSASTASIMANDIGFDFNKRSSSKEPIKILSLVENTALISAIGNDLGYENIFLEQLKIHYRFGDLFIAISASGNSGNLIKASKWVINNGGEAFGLLGFDGGELAKICNNSIIVPANKGDYGPVEDFHLVINHFLAFWLENRYK